MKRFFFGLVPGAVFGAAVALAAQTMAPPSFEAFVGEVARSVSSLRQPPSLDPAVEPAPPSQMSQVPQRSEHASAPMLAATTDETSGAVLTDGRRSRSESIPEPASKPTSEPSSEASSESASDSSGLSGATPVSSSAAVPSSSDAAVLPEAFAEDYAWWGRVDDAGEAAAEEPGAVVSAGIANPRSGRTARERVDTAHAHAAREGTASRASVWIPFHSERSAAGFAQRLTRALQRPFGVERQGAGRYQVVFAYADQAERDEVFARVAQITGEGS